jgi:hypothetical protein
MKRSLVPVVSEILDTYYDTYFEFEGPAEAFDVSLPSSRTWIAAAHYLLDNVEIGNNRALLEGALEQISVRIQKRVIGAMTINEQELHAKMSEMMTRVEKELGRSAIPHEVSISENHEFTAKSEVRELFESGKTAVLVVDPYIGTGTLDCLRSCGSSIRLLTGKHPNSIEKGFLTALSDFQKEGHSIELRRHLKIHDRHFVFNERCWLVGSSLKDAGKKHFNCIEIIDSKQEVVSGLESKWREADVVSASPETATNE